MQDLDVDLFGGLPGREPSEASGDAQADIEHALLHKARLVLMSLDFTKYFDSFDLPFTQAMLRHAGFPPAMVHWWSAVYAQLHRTIKIGSSYGKPFKPFNGIGQGDSISLFPAILLVH